MRIKFLVASTLVEVLVVILISGILLLMLFEGTELVQKYTAEYRSRSGAGRELFEGYSRLEKLFWVSDSIGSASSGAVFYKHGHRYAEAEIKDSLLIVVTRQSRDTLFRRVKTWLHRRDSLHLRVGVNRQEVFLHFGIYMKKR